MQHEPWRPGAEPAWMAPTTVDEASMERSKSFVKALQVTPHGSDLILVSPNSFVFLFSCSIELVCEDPGLPGAWTALDSILALFSAY